MNVSRRFRIRAQPTPLVGTRGKLSAEGNTSDAFPAFSLDVKFFNTSSNSGVFENSTNVRHAPATDLQCSIVQIS